MRDYPHYGICQECLRTADLDNILICEACTMIRTKFMETRIKDAFEGLDKHVSKVTNYQVFKAGYLAAAKFYQKLI